MSRFVDPQTSVMVAPGSLAGDAKPACAPETPHGPGRFALAGASLDPPTGEPPADQVGPDEDDLGEPWNTSALIR